MVGNDHKIQLREGRDKKQLPSLRSKSGGFLPFRSSGSYPSPTYPLEITREQEEQSPSDSPCFRKTKRMKKLRKRLTRSTSGTLDKITEQGLKHAFISVTSPRSSTNGKAHFAQKTISMDPRLQEDIALFYVRQKLPDTFPNVVLCSMYRRNGQSLWELEKLLSNRGWTLELPQVCEDSSIPQYYFGLWGYDLWCVFEGRSTGSFVTCYLHHQYYVMFVDAYGKIQIQKIEKGPWVNGRDIENFSLKYAVTRPPKRFICKKCGINTPCQQLNNQATKEHRSVLADFVVH